MSATEKVTVEQVSAGDKVTFNADGTNYFVVKSIRDGMSSGVGFRSTEGAYVKLPWGSTVYRVTEEG